MGVGDAQLGRVDVAEDGPDEGHRGYRLSAVGELEDGAVAAQPVAQRVDVERRAGRRRVATGERARPCPAAWPMAMHWAIERTEAWASWVAEKQRPATSTLAASRTTSVR